MTNLESGSGPWGCFPIFLAVLEWMADFSHKMSRFSTLFGVGCPLFLPWLSHLSPYAGRIFVRYSERDKRLVLLGAKGGTALTKFIFWLGTFWHKRVIVRGTIKGARFVELFFRGQPLCKSC